MNRQQHPLLYLVDYYDSHGYHHWPSRMKEEITTDELEKLEHNTENMSKHDLIPPVVAFDINSALKRSRNHGKGVDIFRRNQQRAEEFVVDENNRQRSEFPNKLDNQVSNYETYIKTYRSPWNAAWEGNLERAFTKVDPCAERSVRDEEALRRDDNKHSLSFDRSHVSNGCIKVTHYVVMMIMIIVIAIVIV